MESESGWLGSAFTPQDQAKTGIEEHPTQNIGLAPNPIVSQTQIRHFGNFKYTRLFNIKPFTLQPMYGVYVPDFMHLARDFESTKGSQALNTIDLQQK